MYSYSIGLILERERKKANVSQRELAKGICAFQMISKIEKKKGDADKLLMDILLQRLGKAPDRLECILSKDEYNKIRARDMIGQLIAKGKGYKAKYLLAKYYENVKQENVQKMYYYRTMADIALRCYDDVNSALKNIIKAIEITIPDFLDCGIEVQLLSTFEIENLLFYAKILWLTNKKDDAMRITIICLEYIKTHQIDEEEKAKIYPKCVWMWIKVNQNETEIENTIMMCEEALQLLRKRAIIYFMLPLMEELIALYRKVKNKEREDYWASYAETLKELHLLYAPDICVDSLLDNCYQCEYHLDYEIIRSERIIQKITQEKIIEGIYEYPVSISNMERGKTSPTKRNLESLLDRMGLNKSRYNGFVATNNYDVLELREKLREKLSRYNSEEGYQYLQMLKTEIDMSHPENKRLIESQEINLLLTSNSISPKEARERLEKLLEETYQITDPIKMRVPLNSENIIINAICIGYGEDEMFNKGIDIYRTVLDTYKRSKVDCKFHYRQYDLLLGNYTSFMCESGNYIEEIQAYIANALGLALRCGKGNGIRIYLRGLAQYYCNEQHNEKAKQFFHYAIQMAELVNNDCAARITREMEKRLLKI